MEFIGLLWDEGIVRPLTNTLLMLYSLTAHNLGLAIIVLTFLIRGLTYPLTKRQLRQTQKMQQMQTHVQAIKDRYPNDPNRRSQEQMKLYREMGVSPFGCLGPFAVQIPILIGLFMVVRNTVGVTPEGLASLAMNIYGWLPLNQVIPVDRSFLWMDLGQPDPSFILPVLSGVTMWLQQKMSMVANSNPQQQSTQKMMLWMMPIFFVTISTRFFSGVVLYWVASNLIGIVMQYFISGLGGLRPAQRDQLQAKNVGTSTNNEESSNNGRSRKDRTVSKDGGRSDRNSPPGTGRKPRRGRGGRP